MFDHSRRMFLFASLKGRYRRIEADPELLYVGAMFHDLGLTEHYRRTDQLFKVDDADLARDFLLDHGRGAAEEIAAVAAAHPRPDFKNNILRAFYDGMKDRPDSSTAQTEENRQDQHLCPGFIASPALAASPQAVLVDLIELHPHPKQTHWTDNHANRRQHMHESKALSSA